MKQEFCGKPDAPETGFTLIETLMALAILAFGLLSAGQLIFVAMGSASLARSKESAALIAQNKLEMLGDLYRRAPGAPELTEGGHSGEQVQVTGGRSVLNRYSISWQVSTVPDPRGGVFQHARRVTVTVTPVGANGAVNVRAALNKIVHVSSVFFSESR